MICGPIRTNTKIHKIQIEMETQYSFFYVCIRKIVITNDVFAFVSGARRRRIVKIVKIHLRTGDSLKQLYVTNNCSQYTEKNSCVLCVH